MRDRSTEVQRVRRELERASYPRLQMMLLVSITGCVGFIGSYVMLEVGITTMWLRYPIAVAIAYVVFLGLLWLWLRTRSEDYLDGTNLSSGRGEHPAESSFGGKGGEGGGGGASGRFDSGESSVSMDTDPVASVTDAVSSVGEAEEFAIPLVALAFLAVLVLSSFWIVWSAPVLFAELLVDGLLTTTLYRRLRSLDSRHWLETAVRRTAIPFLSIALLVALGGLGMSLYAPHAQTLGDVARVARDQ